MTGHWTLWRRCLRQGNKARVPGHGGPEPPVIADRGDVLAEPIKHFSRAKLRSPEVGLPARLDIGALAIREGREAAQPERARLGRVTPGRNLDPHAKGTRRTHQVRPSINRAIFLRWSREFSPQKSAQRRATGCARASASVMTSPDHLPPATGAPDRPHLHRVIAQVASRARRRPPRDRASLSIVMAGTGPA